MNRRESFRGLVGAACLILLCVVVAQLHAATSAKPIRFDEETMTAPKPIHKVSPQYPKDAKEEGVQGRVVLDAVIDEKGRVTDTKIVEAADPRLTEAARAAVSQWRYEPLLDDEGKAHSVLFRVTIKFRLDGDKNAEKKK